MGGRSVPPKGMIEMSSNTNVFFRHDTFLGVCEALGQDFGFNPNYLRAIFSLVVLFSPVLILSLYLGLGVVIAVSRWLYPPRTDGQGEVAVESVVAPSGANDAKRIELREAA